MAELKDSGNRREFESGAVRDMQEGKGRCDLIPWKEAWEVRQSIYNRVCGSQMGFHYTNRTDETGATYERNDPKDLWYFMSRQFEELDKEFNDPEYCKDNVMVPFTRMNFIHDRFIQMAAIFITYVYGREEDDRHFEWLQEKDPKKMEDFSWACWTEAMREVAKHYEDGARKYSENNWRKGMDCKIYFDSACRHLLKWFDDWWDEPHDRAFVWNCLGGAYEARQEAHKIAVEDLNKKYGTASADTEATNTCCCDLERHEYADPAMVPDSLKVTQSAEAFKSVLGEPQYM